MAHVLVVHGEPLTASRHRQILSRAGHRVDAAVTGGEALRIARENDLDLVVARSTLPDMGGIDTLRLLRCERSCSAFIVTSLSAETPLIIEAMRLGARDWLGEPVDETDLVAAVERALTNFPAPADVSTIEPHALTRLAEKAVCFVGSPEDHATLLALGRAVGISSGGLRNWCRTARIRPRAFRQFARGLRAVYRYERDSTLGVENLVKVVDRRTLERFLVASGGTPSALPATVEEFLQRQRFLSRADAIAAVRHAMVKQGRVSLFGA